MTALAAVLGAGLTVTVALLFAGIVIGRFINAGDQRAPVQPVPGVYGPDQRAGDGEAGELADWLGGGDLHGERR